MTGLGGNYYRLPLNTSLNPFPLRLSVSLLYDNFFLSLLVIYLCSLVATSGSLYSVCHFALVALLVFFPSGGGQGGLKTLSLFLGLLLPLTGRFLPDLFPLLALCLLIRARISLLESTFSHLLLILFGWTLIAFIRLAWSGAWLLFLPFIHILVAVSLLGGFVAFFENRREASDYFLQGLLRGMWFVLPIASLQILGHSSLKESSSFWAGVERYSATFRDPNEWGMITVCLLPFLVVKKQWVLLVAWLALSLFSGSRLLLLGTFLFFASLFYSSFIHKGGRIRTPLLVLGTVLLVVSLPAFLPTSTMPAPIQRQLSSLDFSRLTSTFDSRWKFWSLSFRVWQDNPLMGVGLGSFPMVMTSYATLMGNDLNLWVDNPNSLYLWILVELGLFGLLAFLYGMKEFRFRSEGAGPCVVAVLLLVLLLQFGPHIFFPEVSVLTALIMSMALCRPASRRNQKISLMLPLLLTLIWARFSQFGWYGWEREGRQVQRWSAPSAQAFFLCQNKKIKFEVRTLIPTNGVVSTGTQRYQAYFQPGKWEPVSFECNRSSLVQFYTDSAWIPATSGYEGDWRTLGFQLRIDPSLSFRP